MSALRRKRSRGQALVETAMMAPILIVMLVTVIDLGRAAYVYTTLSNSVREGARVAIRTGAVRPTNSDVVAAVQKYGEGLSLAAAPCVNGNNTSPSMPAPTSSNVGYVYVTAGPSSSANAPSGQASASAGGGCAAVNPAFGGPYPLSVTVKYSFQPLTPFGQQFFGGRIVISVTSTMTTEY
jgi:Flp pilus assembly protein TadG